MKLSAPLTAYLKRHKLAHEVVEHKTVFTAYDLAQTLKVKLDTVAKTLLLKVQQPKAVSPDEREQKAMRHILAVLPASRRLDLARVKKVLKAKAVSIASEKDITKALRLKPGRQTPFGSLHGVRVVMDAALLKTTRALFSAGHFTSSLRLKVKDYRKAEQPLVGDIGKKT